MKYLKTPEITAPLRGDQNIYHQSKTLVADDIGQLDILANSFFEYLAQDPNWVPQIISTSYSHAVIPKDGPVKEKLQHYIHIHYVLIGG